MTRTEAVHQLIDKAVDDWQDQLNAGSLTSIQFLVRFHADGWPKTVLVTPQAERRPGDG